MQLGIIKVNVLGMMERLRCVPDARPDVCRSRQATRQAYRHSCLSLSRTVHLLISCRLQQELRDDREIWFDQLALEVSRRTSVEEVLQAAEDELECLREDHTVRVPMPVYAYILLGYCLYPNEMTVQHLELLSTLITSYRGMRSCKAIEHIVAGMQAVGILCSEKFEMIHDLRCAKAAQQEALERHVSQVKHSLLASTMCFCGVMS